MEFNMVGPKLLLSKQFLLDFFSEDFVKEMIKEQELRDEATYIELLRTVAALKARMESMESKVSILADVLGYFGVLCPMCNTSMFLKEVPQGFAWKCRGCGILMGTAKLLEQSKQGFR
jgi:tRNA(Ile2) C34 agmatinyltransferase TiaS